VIFVTKFGPVDYTYSFVRKDYACSK